jgi:hypothetical protein
VLSCVLLCSRHAAARSTQERWALAERSGDRLVAVRTVRVLGPGARKNSVLSGPQVEHVHGDPARWQLLCKAVEAAQ